MAKFVKLEDIYTSKESSLEELKIITDDNMLDQLEFCMGLDRGEVWKYVESPLGTVSIHSDMIPLLRSGTWALLPSMEILEKMYTLYDNNHKFGTSSRTMFLADIPAAEYEYELVWVKSSGAEILYAGDHGYKYPLKNFPRVRSSLHPCFLFPSLVHFWTRPHANVAVKMLGDRFRQCVFIQLVLHTPTCRDFIGSTHTQRDFPRRRLPIVRPEPRPHVERRRPDSRRALTASNADHTAPAPPLASKSREKVTIATPSSSTSLIIASSSKKPMKSALKKASAPSTAKTGQKRKAAANEEPGVAKRRSPRFVKGV